MKKIFEIPVYALSKGLLKERSEKHIDTWKKKNIVNDCSKETVKEIIEMQFFPQRVWDYNHIIGYIEICVNDYDIEFNAYMPHKGMNRYCWWSKAKTLLMKDMWNGAHIRIKERYTNSEIQNMVDVMLSDLIKEHIRGKRYVDRAAFDNVNKNLDYITIINGGKN